MSEKPRFPVEETVFDKQRALLRHVSRGQLIKLVEGDGIQVEFLEQFKDYPNVTFETAPLEEFREIWVGIWDPETPAEGWEALIEAGITKGE